MTTNPAWFLLMAGAATLVLAVGLATGNPWMEVSGGIGLAGMLLRPTLSAVACAVNVVVVVAAVAILGLYLKASRKA